MKFSGKLLDINLGLTLKYSRLKRGHPVSNEILKVSVAIEN